LRFVIVVVSAAAIAIASITLPIRRRLFVWPGGDARHSIEDHLRSLRREPVRSENTLVTLEVLLIKCIWLQHDYWELDVDSA